MRQGMAGEMAQTDRRKLTYDDYVLFPEDGKRHELIDGEHYVSPSPNTRHQAVLGALYLAIGAFVKAQRLGRAFFAPYDVVFTRFDVVEPDLLFVGAGRSDVITAANLQGAPDLAVEVLSPSNRSYDEKLKRDLYERGGVAEYWLVDPEAETVKVYRRASGGFERPVLLDRREGDALTTPLLPGFALPLDELFAE